MGATTPLAHKNITRDEANFLSNKFMAMAQALEVAMTKTCKRLAKQTGSKLHGLAYRLKDSASATRKILKESAEERI